jgi:hypothetical protein
LIKGGFPLKSGKFPLISIRDWLIQGISVDINLDLVDKRWISVEIWEISVDINRGLVDKGDFG